MERIDPVHLENGKWYYWIETGADKNGPFDTEEEAREDMKSYCEFLNFAGEEEKTG